ncbi:MAG: 30S ribosomal protein S11 [Candidatus Wallbacteria bacterium]|nr:30S ribosomal protein S11 [Candidatus Wallbacteria bacterium]
MARKRAEKRKEKKIVSNGIVCINTTFNNTIISITDPKGNLVSWSSGGNVGFKGARKGTAYAAQLAAENAAKKALDFGMREVIVMLCGPGSGRETAIRSIQTAGLSIKLIKDITPIPHNGCRPPKRRRV